MKLNLQSIESRLNAVSADFTEKFIEAAQKALAKPEEIIGSALAVFVGFMMVGMAVHLFLPEIGPDWREFVWWLFKVSAFFLICFFGAYLVIKAGREIDLNPTAAQIPAKSAAADMQAPPYAIIYARPAEDVAQFEQRAVAAVNSKAPIIIIAFRDPVVLIRDAQGTEVRALRGGMPWEDGALAFDDIASEGYLSYMNYVR
ncbi:MAG: hypothetical protein RMJ33_13905, partial [Saprospiraceae bacterium]|nr:hypothetical protein [Saprospiraceae bacterium]